MALFEMFFEETQITPPRSFREVWFEFETWERSRGFRDDPSHPSKVALDWIRDLYELDAALNDFAGADAVQACHAAMESLFVSFTRLEHHPELEQAVMRWKQVRSAEAAAPDITVGNP